MVKKRLSGAALNDIASSRSGSPDGLNRISVDFKRPRSGVALNDIIFMMERTQSSCIVVVWQSARSRVWQEFSLTTYMVRPPGKTEREGKKLK